MAAMDAPKVKSKPKSNEVAVVDSDTLAKRQHAADAVSTYGRGDKIRLKV